MDTREALEMAIAALRHELVAYGPEHRKITAGLPAAQHEQQLAARYARILQAITRLRELML